MATIQDSLADPAVLEEGTGVTITQAAPGDPVVIASTGSYTDEQARDAIAAALVAGSNVTITPNDGADTITISATDTNTTDPEVVRDTIGSALVAGANVSITVNDAGDTITIAATDTNTTDQEVVRDTIAAALVAGTNITITPNDAGDTITIAASGSSGTGREVAYGSAKRTAGDIVFSSTGWQDVSSSLDITLTGVQAGDRIDYTPSFYVGTTATVIYFDVATMVSGSPVNYFGTAGGASDQGVTGWVCPASIGAPVQGTFSYVLQSGDISSGSVTLRLRARPSSSTSRTMNANATSPAVVMARAVR